MNRQYSYPASFDESLVNALKSYDLALTDSKALAKCVQALSDFFISKPDTPTPWNETWAQVAYLSYFLPLNSARLSAIVDEADKRGFFKGLDRVIDFGAGLATASLVISEKHKLRFQLIERANEPQKLVEKFFPQFTAEEWQKTFSAPKLRDPKKTLAVFSYSLTELAELPEWALDCEALMLVEPSTQQDGRKLMALREKLLKKGYHVWAPCTHEGPCPLLTQSKTDWCHDRVHFQAPPWFLKMEEQLPMKNRTLTMSYLLMRKTAPTKINAARTVGDMMKEKGKNRQMVCRGPEREFLAWLHKTKIEQEIPRGVLIEIPESAQKVSNELRITSEITVL
jgi:Predicted rRNA methylase